MPTSLNGYSRMQFLKRFFSCLLILICAINASWADVTNNQGNGNTAQPLPAGMSTCPLPNQLVQQNLLWMAPGGWATHYPSFIKSIATFTGAHWVGVNVGQVICTYSGQQKFTFPLSLENAAFVKQPSGWLWNQKRDNEGGVIHCFSNNVNDCPFIQVQNDDSNINYDDLMDLKPSNSGEDL